jgi:pseudouridine synthase
LGNIIVTEPKSIRLNKFISDSGYCSRREADKLIEQGRVIINGHIAELGTRVLATDNVLVNGKTITPSAANKSDRVYILYNKPVGITCTTERHVKGNIIDAVGHNERIFPIGRLDKPSEGLILLTSDGDMVNKVLRAENAHDKEYWVSVDQPISEKFIRKMASGVPVLDQITKPCEVYYQGRNEFTIILTQGLNRQIRRMCSFLGYEVTRLVRTRIMHLTGDNLKPGQWRDLTAAELTQLNTAVKDSSKTASPVAPSKKTETPKAQPSVWAAKTSSKGLVKQVVNKRPKTRQTLSLKPTSDNPWQQNKKK